MTVSAAADTEIVGRGISYEVLDAEYGGGKESIAGRMLDSFAPVDEFLIRVNLSSRSKQLEQATSVTKDR